MLKVGEHKTTTVQVTIRGKAEDCYITERRNEQGTRVCFAVREHSQSFGLSFETAYANDAGRWDSDTRCKWARDAFTAYFAN